MGRPRPRGRHAAVAASAATSASSNPEPQSTASGSSTKKTRLGRPATSNISTSRIRCLKFKVTEKDDEMVACSVCSESFTFRAFRLHNIEKHYNIGTTADDKSILDHKFYERKLRELSRLLGIKQFTCPRGREDGEACGASFKSALGLSYHLETCGKTQEEITACLIECEECGLKFNAPNLVWHKKLHRRVEEERLGLRPVPGPRRANSDRQSAQKARKVIKDAEADDEDGPKPKNIQLDPDEVDADYQIPRPPARIRKSSKKKQTNVVEIGGDVVQDQDQTPEAPSGPAFVYQPTVVYILGTYDTYLRNPLESSSPLISPIKPTIRTNLHLPAGRPSMELHTQIVKCLESTGQSSLCTWDPVEPKTKNPFGQVSVNLNPLNSPKNNKEFRSYLPQMKTSINFRTKIQIPSLFKPRKNACSTINRNWAKYSTTDYHRLNWFQCEIVGGGETGGKNWVIFTGGPITSLSWHPTGTYLAVATLKNSDQNPNVMESTSPGTSSSIQIYSKVTLEEDPDSSGFNLEMIYCFEGYGQINHIQWANYLGSSEEEESDSLIGWIACAFEDSSCRIMGVRKVDLEQKFNFVDQPNSKIRVYKKLPEICLSIGDESETRTPGQCLIFNWHESNGYFGTGYASGQVGLFNLETTSKLLTNTKDNITYYFPFWLIDSHTGPIRGLIIDPANPRYIYTGSMDKTLRAWDVELRTEIECKRIGCIIDMSWVRGWVHVGVSFDGAMSNQSSHMIVLRFYQLGRSRGEPNALEYFNITSSSLFEGMLLSGLENGRVVSTYYDSFWRDCDYERNKRKRNVIVLSTVQLDDESFTPGPEVKKVEEIIPFREDEEPRITILLSNERKLQTSAQAEPSPQFIENFYRFYKYLRINKVSWSPKGEYFGVGYRNGLLTIHPGTFNKLYKDYYR